MSSEVVWQGYRIIAGTLKSGPAAQVYLGKTRATELRFAGETVEAAIEAARGWVDARVAANVASRRAPHIGTAGEYADYFTAHGLRYHERLMLAAHVEAGALTADELADAAGWSSFEPANLHYGWLGREVAQSLGLDLSDKPSATGGPTWTCALAEWSGEPSFRWHIHPELVEGLVLSGALRRAPDR